MPLTANITRPAPVTVDRLARNRKPLPLRLLDWLADCNAQYVAAQRTAQLTEDQLRDVGLCRKDLDGAFYRARGPVADDAPNPIITRIRGYH